MKVLQLKQKLEAFKEALESHLKLYSESIGRITNEIEYNEKEIDSQSKALLRELGSLRQYLEYYRKSWIINIYNSQCSILDHAVGSADPRIKGPCLKSLIDHIVLILGQLDELPVTQEVRITEYSESTPDEELAIRVCSRIKQAVRALRERRKDKVPFAMDDEYDVQDLLKCLMRAYFKYTIGENPILKVAGAKSSRVDISIEEIGVLIEAKFVRSPIDQARIEKEISEDLTQYTAWSPLQKLIFVIYNSDDLENADALDKLSGTHTHAGKSFDAIIVKA
jgi:hypothetical protein